MEGIMSSGKSGGYGKKHINKKCDKNNKAGWVFILAATIMLVIAGGRLYSDSEERQLQKGIASNIIRFHVRAESDSKEDQWLKLQVKEAVLAYISPVLSKSQSVDESRQLLYNESENIRNVAAATLRSLGDESDVNVYFENCYFPMKTYGDMTFPPGEYEAFRVDIGEAQGKNCGVSYIHLYVLLMLYMVRFQRSQRKNLKECSQRKNTVWYQGKM